jgi:GNAT superfamily N-acetyltransferase
VARTLAGTVVGFALVELIDGHPHLEEMDVHPAFGRRGIGSRLLEAVRDWTRSAGYPGITLTTFREVPWNAPFYARAGYRALKSHELSPALRELVRSEAARGLDPVTRVVMWLELRDTPGGTR